MNKAKYINAELAKAEFTGNFQDTYPTALVKALIDNTPTADVQEIRHGKNIGEDYAACDQFVCSECKIELQDWTRVERDEDDGDETYHDYVFKFCPNCGAKMDLEG